MATSTFDKQITLNEIAAKRLADEFEKDIRPLRPDISKEKKESEEAWKKLLNRYVK